MKGRGREREADKMQTKFPIRRNMGPEVFASLQTFPHPPEHNNTL